MCTKYKICGKRHYRNPLSGRFQKDRRLVGYFLASAGVGFILVLSFVGINTILNKLASLGKIIVIENAVAQSPLTWQEEVIQTLKEYGIDAIKVDKLIACESSWNPKILHYNKYSVDQGLWQINSVAHSEVSKSCALDSNCSTIEAIRIIKTKGWNEWSCVTKGLI